MHSKALAGRSADLSFALGEDIKELYLDITLLTEGASFLNYSYAVCEEDLPKFSFCGRRKGGKLSVRPCLRGPGTRAPAGQALTCGRAPAHVPAAESRVPSNSHGLSAGPPLRGRCANQMKRACEVLYKHDVGHVVAPYL